jgi:hypothetical protein
MHAQYKKQETRKETGKALVDCELAFILKKKKKIPTTTLFFDMRDSQHTTTYQHDGE